MLKVMIEHYAPLLTSIKTMFGFKSSPVIGVAVTSAFSIETVTHLLLNGSFLGVSSVILIIVSFLILVDWAFGSAASRKLALLAKLNKDDATYKKYKFSSVKISHTIFKFISLFLWLILAASATGYTASVLWLAPVIEGIVIVPILLFAFREFISIGEAMGVLNGSKPFLFEMGEKIFDILQFKFLSKLKGDSSDSYSDYED